MTNAASGAARRLSSLPLPARLVLVLSFCVGFADGLIVPFLALWIAQAAHIGPAWIGPLMACYAGGELVATPFIGGAADRFGRRPVLLASLAGVGVGLALLTFCTHAASFAAVLLFIGISECTLHPTLSTVIGDAVADGDARIAFTWSRLASNVGHVAGPFVGALVVAAGMGRAFLLAGGVCVAAALFAAVALRETRTADSEADDDDDESLAGLLPAFRDRRLASILLRVLGIELCAGWIPAVLPLFAHDSDALGATQIAWLFTYEAVLVCVFQYGGTHFVHRLAGDRLVRWAGGALAAAFLVIAMVHGLEGMAVGVSLLAVSQAMLEPLIPTAVNALAPSGRRATYMAAGSVVNDLKDTLSPAVGTMVYALAPALPWLLGGPLALAAGWSLASAMKSQAAASRCNEPGSPD